ncbi:DUF732 domain-containing protein [Mycolicibacterium neoaurum]|uniref:DUF732 domain-containing protein n=1 Tax=Mycolicibacterium neoaurum TaxID=1795 RepID=UPI001BD16788|nr:DUF732 domain-containing protein [Mycolicibacterium neoaurum]QVI27231.1 DUF732 domain-containing protein [Mycolicibacterium neoaurum]
MAVGRLAICLGVSLGAIMSAAPSAPAGADTVAYLVNVTVRPGYNFANAESAISYGHTICGKVAHAHPYLDLKRDVMNDFTTSDDYQAAYLISQAVGELCPAQIWQLRQLAATRFDQGQ